MPKVLTGLARLLQLLGVRLTVMVEVIAGTLWLLQEQLPLPRCPSRRGSVMGRERKGSWS